MSGTTLTCVPNELLRAQGAALLRIAADLHNLIDGDEEIPQAFRDDLAQLEQIGMWAIVATTYLMQTGKTYEMPLTFGGGIVGIAPSTAVQQTT